VADARFEIHPDFHPAEAVITDAKGRFSVPAVADGTYSFRLTKAQFQTVEGTVVVRRKRRFPSPFKLTMSAATERIAAADAQGAPA
jgi:hypothetical protein